MKAIRAAAIGLALCATTLNARAAELCALFGDLTTLQTAAVQQLLMVSALACNEVDPYNAFVIGHQSELQKSDRDLQSFFARLKTETGVDDYNAFKTRIANTYSLLSAQDKEEYCALTRAALERSQDRTGSLQEFVLSQPFVLAIGYRSCGTTIAGAKFSILPLARAPQAPAQAQKLPSSRTVTNAPAQQTPESPGASWAIHRGTDYFYIGRSLRDLYAPYTYYWRR
jgi:hypothetical protein